MPDHYTLDLDPQQLRNVAKFLSDAEEHARTKGTQVAGTPDEIGGQWTGDAARTIKGEMRALGKVMSSGPKNFAGEFKNAEQALEGLATHFDTALEDLAALNTRWKAAQTEYDEAAIGDHDPDGAAETPTERRDRKQGATDTEFDELKTWCRAKVRACGEVLAVASPIGYYGYQGSTLGYSTNVDALLPLLSLTQQRHDMLKERAESEAQARKDAKTLQEMLDGREPFESQEIRDYMAGLADKADDPAYARAFAEAGGAQLLKDAYDAAENDRATDSQIGMEDWEAPLKALNDVYAAGMEQLSGKELGAIAAELGSAKYIGILTAITGSDHSGPRTASAVLPFAHYLEEQIPGGSPSEMTRWMSQLANGELSPEEIIEGYRDDMLDAGDLSQLVEEMDPKDRERWISELLNDRGNPYDEQVTKNWNEILPGLLEAARDDEALKVLGDLFSAVDGYQQPADADYDFGKFFTDPKTIDLLAQYPGTLGSYQGDFASLFEKYVEAEDVNELLKNIIQRDMENGTGISASARHLGYILGLASKAHIDFDMNGVIGPLAEHVQSELTTKLGELIAKGAGAATQSAYGAALAGLEAIIAEAKKEGEAREQFTKEWESEALHQTMAWMLYLERNGVPPAYEEWKSGSGAGVDPLLEGPQFLEWLSGQDEDSDAYELWENELRDLVNDVGDTNK